VQGHGAHLLDGASLRPHDGVGGVLVAVEQLIQEDELRRRDAFHAAELLQEVDPILACGATTAAVEALRSRSLQAATRTERGEAETEGRGMGMGSTNQRT